MNRPLPGYGFGVGLYDWELEGVTPVLATQTLLTPVYPANSH